VTTRQVPEQQKKLNEINMCVCARLTRFTKRSAKWYEIERLENYVISMTCDFRTKWLWSTGLEKGAEKRAETALFAACRYGLARRKGAEFREKARASG
jgi:hypothetical protein